MGQRPSPVEDGEVTSNFWRGRRVLITGHTGFKGSWLSFWLRHMGALVTGYSLAPIEPSLFTLLRESEFVNHVIGDIRDLDSVKHVVGVSQPEIVFHFAAQSLVRLSYDRPVETYATNVLGTAHVLEAARGADVRAIVVATSDKVYENHEWHWGYRENEPLGGSDPYSSSKACAELVVKAYRASFFMGAGAPRLATARAGNVVGGGDWAHDRLVPDVMRAFATGESVRIRNPRSVRPWQHVLDPLHGYLILAERLFGDDGSLASAWNFGPVGRGENVERLVSRIAAAWGGGSIECEAGPHPPEAVSLHVDSTKARTLLGWKPHLPFEESLDWTVAWYREQMNGADARQLLMRDIEQFEQRCTCSPSAQSVS
jgi:CDP-glucose 4,6-dehydratase